VVEAAFDPVVIAADLKDNAEAASEAEDAALEAEVEAGFEPEEGAEADAGCEAGVVTNCVAKAELRYKAGMDASVGAVSDADSKDSLIDELESNRFKSDPCMLDVLK
jgi:hypothetical protein